MAKFTFCEEGTKDSRSLKEQARKAGLASEFFNNRLERAIDGTIDEAVSRY